MCADCFQADEENQAAAARQDLNELDLSLGLTSHDDEHDSDWPEKQWLT